MVVYPSDLKGINELINGWDDKNPIIIYAPPTTGKTILMLQQTYYLMKKLGKGAIILDTEGGLDRFIEIWHPVFSKQYGIKDKPIIILGRTIEKVMLLHGVGIGLNIHPPTYDSQGRVKSAGKIDLMLTGQYESELENLIKKHNIGILVYDSLTAPLRNQFPSGQQNFPARADATGLWLARMFYLIDMYDLIVVAIAHETLNPTAPFATPTITGGINVAYNFKIILYLEKFKSTKMQNFRKLYQVRYFDQPEWAKSCFLKINDEGYSDVVAGEIEQVIKRNSSKKEVRE